MEEEKWKRKGDAEFIRISVGQIPNYFTTHALNHDYTDVEILDDQGMVYTPHVF